MTIDEFERRLRAITSEADPVPGVVLESAMAALSLRSLDAELAELVADSSVDDAAVVTRALVSDVRMLSFACGDVTVEVDVETDRSSRSLRLHGIAVGAVGDVAVIRAHGRGVVPLADDGRFDAGELDPGPLRMELTTPDGRRVTTAWVSI